MQVTILAFGILKESLGPAAFPLTLAEGATVSDLLENLGTRTTLRGIAVSVNAEYAQPSHKLTEGDEVGLLPPVSGGTARQRAKNAKPTPSI
jgi:molybdopterin converting factor small subunit